MSKSIPKKSQIHLLTVERNYFRNLFVRTSDPQYRKEMNKINRLIKTETGKLNQKSFNFKIGELEIQDRSLYQFAKYLKTNKTVTPPFVKNNLELAYFNQDKANALASAFLGCHFTSHNLTSIYEAEVESSIRIVVESTPAVSTIDKVSKADVEKVKKYLKVRRNF